MNYLLQHNFVEYLGQGRTFFYISINGGITHRLRTP